MTAERREPVAARASAAASAAARAVRAAALAAGVGGGTGGGSGDGGTAICRYGFCWENPLPQGNDLFTVTGSAAGDVWAGGEGATLIHWDGVAWSVDSLPASVQPSIDVVALRAIGGVLFVGLSSGNFQEHLPDGGWMAISNSAVGAGAIAGDSPSSVWFLNPYGRLDRYDGTGFLSYLAVGSNSGEALATDADGGVYFAYLDPGLVTHVEHCDPARPCTPAPITTFDGGLAAMTFLGPSQFRFTATDGTSWRYQPSGATDPLGPTGFIVHAIDVRSDESGFAVGQPLAIAEATSTGWQDVTPPSAWSGLILYGVWSAAGGDGSWVVGLAGEMLDRESGSWKQKSSGPLDQLYTVVVAGGHVYAAGDGAELLERSPNGAWSGVGGLNKVLCSFGLADGGVVLGLYSGDVAFGGGSSSAGPNGQPLTGVARLDDGSVLAGTVDGVISRFDGASWHDEATGLDASVALDAVGPDAWAVAGAALLTRLGDGGWSSQALPVGRLETVWAEPDGGRVWVGGSQASGGPVVGWVDADGDAGTTPLTGGPSSGDIVELEGLGPDDIWALGHTGLWHFTSGGWSYVETGVRQQLNSVAVRSAGGTRELFLVGNRGAILHSAY